MQGTAGNIVPPEEFLPAVNDAAHEVGALFIADEMITGFGRTGKPWGVDHTPGVKPDIITLGKGFGSGFPVSGVLSTTADNEHAAMEQTVGCVEQLRRQSTSASKGSSVSAAGAHHSIAIVFGRTRLMSGR